MNATLQAEVNRKSSLERIGRIAVEQLGMHVSTVAAALVYYVLRAPRRRTPEARKESLNEERLMGRPTEASAHERLRRRVLVLKIGLLFFTVVLALRLVQIQVIHGARYQEAARRQYESRWISLLRGGSSPTGHGKSPGVQCHANQLRRGSEDCGK